MIPSTDCEFSNKPTAALAMLTSTKSSLLDRISPKPEVPDKRFLINRASLQRCAGHRSSAQALQVQIYASASSTNWSLLNIPGRKPVWFSASKLHGSEGTADRIFV